MGLPAVNKEGVKCTYFVLRKDFLFGHSGAPKSLTPPSEPFPGSAEFDNERPMISKTEKIPRGRILLQPSDISSNFMDRESGRTCKHMIPQSFEDRSINCEFFRGEKLVEEAVRNNDLLAEEADDVSSAGVKACIPRTGVGSRLKHAPCRGRCDQYVGPSFLVATLNQVRGKI